MGRQQTPVDQLLKTLKGRIEGSTVIDENTALNGTVIGNTEVSSNVEFSLYGEIIGDLSLRRDSIVRLYGTVNGNVVNEGGNLQVFGIVGGRISEKGGKTHIDPKAIVLGNGDAHL